MNKQTTKLEKFLSESWYFITDSFIGTWRKRSIGLLSVLFGFYVGSILTSYYMDSLGQRSIVSLFMVLFVEVMIRLRSSRFNKNPVALFTVMDNFRIGAVYAVVLEAFKLGS